jgi:hypothetical protein
MLGRMLRTSSFMFILERKTQSKGRTWGVEDALVIPKILYNSEQVTGVAQYMGLKETCIPPRRYKKRS